MFEMMKKWFGGSEVVDFKELVRQGAIIIDVRTPDEYKSGHIAHSINIPLDQINRKAAELARKNKVIITCCRSGGRSGMAVQALKNYGITSYNGGAWNVLSQKIN